MKPSRYNFIWPAENSDNMIIYNSMTGGLVETEKTCIDLLSADRIDYNSLSPRGKQFIDRMKQGGFVIDDVVDELLILKKMYNSSKYNRSKLPITIVPTMRCNFDCIYCFQHPGEGEEPRYDKGMSETVQQALLEFITDRANKLDSLHIFWYGGEPLLEKDLIYTLSKKMIDIAAQNNIAYYAKMVTNGYLIAHDPKIIQRLKDSKITSLQITLDGPPEVHNRRRMLKGSHKPTFDRILQGIKLLAEEGFDVTIRINTDKSNVHDTDKLLDILYSNNLKNVHIYQGFVYADTPGCHNYQCSTLTLEQARDLKIEFHKSLLQKQFNIDKARYYPSLTFACGACSPDAYIISPDGDLYKCWKETGRKEASVGNITNFKARSNSQRMHEIRWLLWEPFTNDHCPECKRLPICMGGCGYSEIVNGQPKKCNPLDDHLEQYIKTLYFHEKSQL
ncbi:radical SAM/SPASM domain-containing protein [Desulfoscipio gibsoniae]|uniref:Radical SAM additional 4Fe4S-binding domain protein n=1 Tax=Desulfoscipio gibsoniae DSM 7213 TaxID=767817 RepID=R4KRM2_9FIRM|nr:radical SAM protein [Desulfoscipio gibsoniae]AGL02256.1 radical SAM additional 4Fe4S-binding domain protein [Desulfoscipio gibsoniae DSM 7213]